MTWVRLDDSVLSHPKIAACGPEAFVLWVGGLCYANRHATDGHLPAHVLPLLCPASGWSAATLARLSDRLLTAALWRSDERGGWMIHGYDDYQEEAMRASVDARRASAKERKRAQRNRERGDFSTGNGTGHTVTPRDIERDSHAPQSHPVTVVSQAPVPSRPVPSRSLSIESDVTARAESLTAGYERVRLALVAAYRAAGAMVPTRDLSVPHSSLLMSLADAFDGDATAMAETIAGFFADQRAAKEGWPLSWLAKNPNAYRRRHGGGSGSPPTSLPADLWDHERLVLSRALRGDWWKPGTKADRWYRALLARHPGIGPTPPEQAVAE